MARDPRLPFYAKNLPIRAIRGNDAFDGTSVAASRPRFRQAVACPGRALAELAGRLASIAKISVEAIRSLKQKIADAMRITAVLRYTASSIYLRCGRHRFDDS